MQQNSAKIVIVGDGAVGKTSLLWRWAKREFKPEHEPTVFENYSTSVPISGADGESSQKLTLWDTGGQETFNMLRQLSYPGTHVFLLCFSLADRLSFDNVTNVWLPEILPYLAGSAPPPGADPDKPAERARVVLVGTKVDLRPDGDDQPELVTREEGSRLATDINAEIYIECSAKTEANVKRVFDEAVRAYLKPQPVPQPPQKKKPCTIL